VRVLRNKVPLNKFKSKFYVCPCCGNNNIAHWLEKEKDGVNFNIYRCLLCKSGFMNPQPTQEFLESIYHLSGHGLLRPISFEQVMAAEADYPNSMVDSKRIVKCAKKLLNLVGPLKVLDIGSGYGFFSREAINEGFDVTAVNPSAWENDVFEKLNGFRPIQSFFEDIDFDKEKFDFIILSQVLEHISDPLQILMKIRTLLSQNGILAIAVPNVNSILVKILKERDNGCLWVPEHLTYFSKEGLFAILKRSGFGINKHLYVSRIPYSILSDLLNLKGSPRKVTNGLVKFCQWLPLRLTDHVGLGFIHNIWAKPFL